MGVIRGRLALKYVVSFKTKFGTISAESADPKELIGVYSQLRQLSIEARSAGPKGKGEHKTLGRGETTAALSAMETRLLNTKFFSKPRTTGETREQLVKLTRRKFTSRKVSQALGILRAKGVLRRTGRRNFFRYST